MPDGWTPVDTAAQGWTPVEGAAPATSTNTGFVHSAINYLPAVGGAVGGLLGGAAGNIPGAVGGATLGGAAGSATKQLIQRMLFPNEAPSTSMDAAKGISQDGVIQGASEAVPRAVFGAASHFIGNPVQMVQRVLKPSMATEFTPNIAKAVFNEGATTAGKARAVLNDLNGQIAGHIDDAAKAGKTVPIDPIVKRLENLRDNSASFGALPQKDVDAINAAIGEFSQHPMIKDGSLPIDAAQKMKIKTGKGLPWDQRGTVAEEIQKEITAGLRDGISTSAPNVAGLNAREADLIPLESILKKAERREGNKDLMGLMPGIAGIGAASLMHGSPAVEAGLAGLLTSGAIHAAKDPNTVLKAAQLANTVGKSPVASQTLNAISPNLIRAILGSQQ